MNSLCKDLYSALCCQMKWMNLTIAILDFGVYLYGGSERSKHLSKCLPQMQKIQKIEPDPNFFYDEWKFLRQCVNVIDTIWGRIYFLTCGNFGLQWPLLLKVFISNNNNTIINTFFYYYYYLPNLRCTNYCKIRIFYIFYKLYRIL